MNFHRILSLLPAAVLLCSSACVSIDYNGEEVQKLPPTTKIQLFYSEKQVPKDGVRVLGGVTVSGGTTYNAQQLENKLKKFALSKGANAIQIISIDRIPAGKARPDQVKNMQGMSWIVNDSSGNAFNYFKEDMLSYSTKQQGEVEIYKIKIQANLLLIGNQK